ncbi:MAG: PAS domain-containing protein [Pseudomonadota bacterium]
MKSPKKTHLSTALPRDRLRAIVRVVLLYAVFAALWILFSDRALELVFHDPRSLMFANTLKGLFFVAVTTLLLFYILLRFSTHQAGETLAGNEKQTGTSVRGLLYLGLAVLAAVFALIGAGAIEHGREGYRQAAGRQLQSIVRLKVTQLEDWLGERNSDAVLAGASSSFNTLLDEWQSSANPATREHLLREMEFFRAVHGYSEILICDAQGNILLRTDADPDHAMTDVLRDAISRSISGGEVLITGFHLMRHPAPAHVHLDFVAPLRLPDEKKPADAAIVLRTNVDSTVFAYLQNWPVPSDSAETILFHQDGDSVHYLNRLRHVPELAFDKRFPLADKRLLASQALAADYLPGELLEGTDYRGVPVIGAAQPVAGTLWWMLAKIDKNEIYSTAHRDALWIGFASLLTWMVSATLVVLLLQRRELRHAQQQRYEQARQLNALKLLSDIAQSSADAIFAKDRQGRYLMFNRAACDFTGKTEDEVIGRDDTALFPPGQAALVQANDRRVIDENRVITSEEALDTPAGTRTFLAIRGPLRDDDGRVVGVYGISRDITERKADEDEMRRHNEELQRFNRAMIGRELEMIRLKREVNRLAAALNQPPPYDLSAIDGISAAPGREEDSRP